MSRPKIIDTHVHFWDMSNPGNLRYSWLEKGAIHPILGDIDAMKSLKYDIHSVYAESRFADVSGFVHVQAALGSPDPVEETRWLTRMHESAPAPFVIVAHADLGTDQADAQLAGHAESPYFVGVRDFATEPMLAAKQVNPQFETSLDRLAADELVFDLDCEWMNMAEATRLATRHPNLTIVLEHIGFPRARDDEYFNSWRNGMAALSSAENVTCKISGLAMTDPFFTRDSLRPWVDTCVELFTPDRCVLGSNWPVDRLYSSYGIIMNLYREYISGLSESEQNKILHGNASRIFKMAA